MLHSPYVTLVFFILSVVLIIFATARYKVHPFIALLLAAYLVAIGGGIPAAGAAMIIGEGFGKIMGQIGLVIVFGTIIGVFLERSGAALRIAEMVLKTFGKRHPALAMTMIGYFISIPVFCDSAYIILSSLRDSVQYRTKASPVALSIALATGLYATHTLVPPTPGPIAAAGNLGLNDSLGLVILAGLVIAIFSALTGYLFAVFSGKRADKEPETTSPFTLEEKHRMPGSLISILPVLIPVFLIAAGSLIKLLFPGDHGILINALLFLGSPLTALFAGFLTALFLVPAGEGKKVVEWIQEGIKSSASILIITGAGGAFGYVLSETGIGTWMGNELSGYSMGIFLPFLMAALIKTAQGSSTVALVTVSALIAPMLPSLGLDSTWGRVLAVMATGAGAMTVSHANDSFFWVVTQFSGMDLRSGYRYLTVATLAMGVVTILAVFAASLVLL